MLILYTFICYSDFVPLLETQYQVGYVSCGLLLLHLLVNLGIISGSSFRTIRLNMQRVLAKCKHGRAMKVKV